MIALIDGDSLLFFSLPKKDVYKTVEECVESLNDRIYNILNTVKAKEYVIFLTGSKNYRKKHWKYSYDYKKTRKDIKLPPVFHYLREYLLQNWNVYTHPNLEADDLVTYYKSIYNDKAVICSPDKDVLFQNVGMHFNYGKMQFIENTERESNYFLWKQIAMGDAGDSVGGIKGVADKTVDKWFKKITDENDYQKIVISEYISRYGIHEGINRFFETFSMVYLLKTDQEMMLEIGELPTATLKEIG